jgi:hypothetical protein
MQPTIETLEAFVAEMKNASIMGHLNSIFDRCTDEVLVEVRSNPTENLNLAPHLVAMVAELTLDLRAATSQINS